MAAILLLLTTPVGEPQADVLDKLIATGILLFILSTINEKITGLIRMYPVQFRVISIFFFAFICFEVINGYRIEKPLNPVSAVLLLGFSTLLSFLIVLNSISLEKIPKRFIQLRVYLSFFKNIRKGSAAREKEREITALSFMLGLIVAFCFNASLFNFFKPGVPFGLDVKSPFADEPSYAFDPDFFKTDFLHVLGLTLTAFFLSFGAKFFHDLLDTLFQVKNLKSKTKEDFSGLNNINEVDKFISTYEESAFREFLDAKLNQPGLFYEADLEKRTVMVKISDPAIKVPDVLEYPSSSGKKLVIHVVKEQGNVIQALGTSLFASAQIANRSPYNGKLKGTAGCFVKGLYSDAVFLLTCYHVVWNGHDWNHYGGNEPKSVVHPFNGTLIGKIHAGIKNRKLDAALIALDDVTPINSIDGIGELSESRGLLPQDVNRPVRMRGSTSSNFTGYISELGKSVHILYPDGNYKELQNLMVIKTRNGKPFSLEGDSGAIIVDSFGTAIGMVVAGDQVDYSFGIPFSEIVGQLNVDIFKTT